MKRFATLVAGALALGAVAGCSSGTTNSDLGVWTPMGAPVFDAGGSSSSILSSSSSSSSSSGGESTSGSSSSSGAVGGSSGSSGGGPSSDGFGPSGSGSSSGSSSSSSSSGARFDAGSGTLPCSVQSVLAAKCTSCHSDPPIAGSLSGLVTFADLMAPAKEDPTKNEAQVSLARMQNATSPMPPASVSMPPTASDISALQTWINGGYASGTACPPDAGAATVSAAVFASGSTFAASGKGCSGQHNVGKDCLQCHGFAFAGTIYDGSGKALSGVEVRVVDSTGMAISTYSCTNGNFYVQNGSFTAPGHTAARNAASTTSMVSAMTNGGCNSCHCTGAGCVTTRIHLP